MENLIFILNSQDFRAISRIWESGNGCFNDKIHRAIYSSAVRGDVCEQECSFVSHRYLDDDGGEGDDDDRYKLS